MLTLRATLATLAVITACNRSVPDREIAASRTHREQQDEQQDIAGARQPPTPSTAVLESRRASPPPASSTRASGASAARHSAARAHRERAVPPRPASQRPDSAPAPHEVRAQPSSVSGASRDSSIGTDSTTGDSSMAGDSSSSRDTGVISDTSGYQSYPGTTGTPPAPEANVVAAGTVIPVSLEDSINSRHDTWGKQITGKVMQNITGPDGEVLVRAGSPLRLTVSRIRSGRAKSKGELELQADSITVEGRAQKLEARVESVPYELKGRGVTEEEAAKVGVGAAGGAVVGGVITGKTRGAVIGGVVGAAAGAAVASQTAAKDVVVAARTPVQVVLTAPLVIR